MGGIHVDLSGKRFGKLLAIKRVYLKTDRHPYYLCRCDCGKEKAIRAASLRNGDTVSCGCYGKEARRIACSKKFGESSGNTWFGVYKGSARRRNISFELTKKEFLYFSQQKCSYCDKEPRLIVKNVANNGDFIGNGIDRIDSSKGYIIGNVVPCCKECNYAKRSMSTDKFLDWVERVYNHSIKDKR